MLLTIEDVVVTRIPRFSVTQEGDVIWTLHINSVTKHDRGQYMCQVNTEPIMTQIGYLDVVGEYFKNFARYIVLTVTVKYGLDCVRKCCKYAELL